MSLLKSKIRSMRSCERGATMVEYALLLSLLALSSVASIGFTGGAVSESFERAADGYGFGLNQGDVNTNDPELPEFVGKE